MSAPGFHWKSPCHSFALIPSVTVFIVILVQLLSVTSYSQPCLPDGITFWSQSKIDSFQYHHPNCTEIEGFMYISGSGITNLNGLSGITSIGGDLGIVYNSILTSLDGLNGLTSVGGDFWIYENPSLIDLGGLSNLVSVDGYVDIGGDWTSGNDLLQDLSGLNNLVSVGGFLQISGNDSLTSLSGLENLSHIGGGLVIWGCNSLPTLSGIGNIDTVQGLTIGRNDALINLEGLESITHINGVLLIYENPQIESLEVLANLTSVTARVDLWGNSSLRSLSGLNNLTSIGGRVELFNNQELSDISALLNLSSIGGELRILYCDSLSTLNGLDNIDATSITDIWIVKNPLLSTCHVQSICDYLANPNGTIEISDNATGCDTQEEVEDSCGIVAISEIYPSEIISAFPNPFTTTTTIEFTLDEKSKIQISIYNTMGEMEYTIEDVYGQGNHTVSWSPRHETAGLYYAVLRSGEAVSVIKMIKQ